MHASIATQPITIAKVIGTALFVLTLSACGGSGVKTPDTSMTSDNNSADTSSSSSGTSNSSTTATVTFTVADREKLDNIQAGAEKNMTTVEMIAELENDFASQSSVASMSGTVATNINAIATNEDSITTNTGSITTNTGSIQTLELASNTSNASIQQNATNITTNADSITTNEGSITTNTGSIQRLITASASAVVNITGDSTSSSIIWEYASGATNSLNIASITNDVFTTDASLTFDNQLILSTNGGSQLASVDFSRYLLASAIVDNLTSTSATSPLAANQGRLLNESITTNTTNITTNATNITANDNDIAALQTRVGTNAGSIQQNAARIAENKVTAVTTNTSNNTLLITYQNNLNNSGANTESLDIASIVDHTRVASATIDTSDNLVLSTSNGTTLATVDLSRYLLTTEIVDNLTSTSATRSLSANQGRELASRITTNTTDITTNTTNITTNTTNIATNRTNIGVEQARSRHMVYKVALIDPATYANTQALVAAYTGQINGTAAIAVSGSALQGIYELDDQGGVIQLSGAFDGLTIVNNEDDNQYKWSNGTFTQTQATATTGGGTSSTESNPAIVYGAATFITTAISEADFLSTYANGAIVSVFPLANAQTQARIDPSSWTISIENAEQSWDSDAGQLRNVAWMENLLLNGSQTINESASIQRVAGQDITITIDAGQVIDLDAFVVRGKGLAGTNANSDLTNGGNISYQYFINNQALTAATAWRRWDRIVITIEDYDTLGWFYINDFGVFENVDALRGIYQVQNGSVVKLLDTTTGQRIMNTTTGNFETL